MSRLRKAKYLNVIISSPLYPASFRVKSLRRFGVKIGGNAIIAPKSYFDSPNVEIGDNVLINRGCEFHNGFKDARIIVGSNVSIGMGTKLICINHDMSDSNRRAGKEVYGDIEIGDSTWISANVTILPNTKIGKGCVIAAGAVVSGVCEDNWVYGGVPAKKIKKL